MAKLYGKEMRKEEILSYVGNLSQLIDARECVLSSGKAEGVRAIDVKTGSGLNFCVLPSRGLDIAWADFQGKALSFLSRSGVVKPECLGYDGHQSDRSFMGGLLTTCGLTNVGPAPEGVGYHGRISNIPAYDVGISRYWEGDEYMVVITGKIRESCAMAGDLELHRTITTSLGRKSFQIEDIVSNEGCRPQVLMLLLHINFGYPIVCENTELFLSASTKVKPLDEVSGKELEHYRTMQRPELNKEYNVFLHETEPGRKAYACLFNHKIQLGAYVKYHTEDFEKFMQWKMMRAGEYVCALEPCNSYSLGRKTLLESKKAKYIEPGEKISFRYQIGVVESLLEMSALEK